MRISNYSLVNVRTKIYRSWDSLKHNPRFLLFIVFAYSFFVKLFYFQFSVEPPRYPPSISLFFLPKIAISLFIASFLFLTKKAWWTIPASFVIDIWIVGNIIYYRASGFFINSEALQMVDNLHGFWDSILIYFSLSEVIPFIITLLYAFYIIKFNKKESKRHIRIFILIIVLTFFMRMFINYFHHSNTVKDIWIRNEKINIECIWKIIRPIVDSQYDAYYAARLYFNHGILSNWWEKQYIIQNTIIDFFFANISYYVSQKDCENKMRKLKHHAQINLLDKKIIDNLIKTDTLPLPTPQTNLIVLLFESLEGWIFENFEGSEHIAPNMKQLINKENILFVPRVKSQAQQGNSGDGQMIVLTGLLPLKVGAACRLYGKNRYPNYAHFFTTSITINPSPGSWNQREVNPNYGFNYLKEFYGDDNQMIDSLIEHGSHAKQPFFLLGITTASHSPFNCNESYRPPLPNDMPTTLKNYLTCVNYTDNVIGKLITKIETNPNWSNTTLVITGDHTVFKEQMLKKFYPYTKTSDISLKSMHNYIPLIIYSPSITSKTIENGIHYQSDIYSTILSLIGEDDYYWKGIGKNILSKDKSNRIDEETGYRISDIIIRNNYFENYRKFNQNNN